jgi:ornithine cyclodeaminase
MSELRFVDAAEIRRVLSFPLLVAALESGHRRAKIEIQDGKLGSEQEQYFVRHAVDRGRFMLSKLITSFPSNLTAGNLPAVQALCILFDGTNGRPVAVLDGTEITYWRTAADSALGAKILAPAEPATLLVVGAGEMSSWLVRAHRAVRASLRRVVIWNRTAERAARVARSLTQEGIEAKAIENLAAAMRSADIICSCTRSHVPLILGRNLRPGMHLDLVGSYTPETREADDEAAQRGLVFVDRRESAFAGVGDILMPIASGAIDAADVLGDLYDLVGGSISGRRAPSDITFFKNAGGAHLDLMTAELVIQQINQ